MQFRLYLVEFKTSTGIKIYGGKRHSPFNDPRHDCYCGSGVYIKRALKKYGRECIVNIQWSKPFPNKDLLAEAEELLVDELIASYDNCVNLVRGGKGGASFYNPEDNPNFGSKRSIESKIKMSEKAKNRVYSEEGLKRRQEATRVMIQHRKPRDVSGSKNPAARRVIVDGVEYSTLKECGDHYGITKNSVFSRIKSKKWEGWNYA
ncbi:homing endonuclease [Escherichia phage phT4A]|uniref:Homing endonuclease n=1 Tax=Escherichia phage phT4A TaxID=1852638 RepID=A0A193GZA0_9CAUD|nr:homing endonuclease [Escherichia phage phT4A]ANN86463.1 homing endonuclease [Escherichia phage phT4A]